MHVHTVLIAFALLTAPAAALDRPFHPPDFHPPVPVLQFGKVYSFKGYLRSAAQGFTLEQIEGSIALPGHPNSRVRTIRLAAGTSPIEVARLFALLRRSTRLGATGVMRPASSRAIIPPQPPKPDVAMELRSFTLRGHTIPDDLPLDRARLEAIAADAVRRQDPFAAQATYTPSYLGDLVIAVHRQIADHTKTFFYDALDGAIE
jgi:hypothetical protein